YSANRLSAPANTCTISAFGLATPPQPTFGPSGTIAPAFANAGMALKSPYTTCQPPAKCSPVKKLNQSPSGSQIGWRLSPSSALAGAVNGAAISSLPNQ